MYKFQGPLFITSRPRRYQRRLFSQSIQRFPFHFTFTSLSSFPVSISNVQLQQGQYHCTKSYKCQDAGLYQNPYNVTDENEEENINEEGYKEINKKTQKTRTSFFVKFFMKFPFKTVKRNFKIFRSKSFFVFYSLMCLSINAWIVQTNPLKTVT